MNRLHRILLTASIHLANIYSFHSLITKLALCRLSGFYRNVVGFLLSMIISMMIVGLVDFMLKKHKLSSFGYSFVRFFVATFVNVALVFLTVFALTFQKGGEFITFQNRMAKFLFYPFLLYAGFFFDLTFSRFAFASKKEYRKNNPQLSTTMIVIAKAVSFTIFVLSFLPILVVSSEYIWGLFNQ